MNLKQKFIINKLKYSANQRAVLPNSDASLGTTDNRHSDTEEINTQFRKVICQWKSC